MHEFKQKVKEIERRLGTDMFVSWTGHVWNRAYSSIRSDQLRMHVLFADAQGVRYRRLPLFSGNHRKIKTEPFQMVTLGKIFRITSGERKGRIVDLSDIAENETCQEAGLNKVLVNGFEPYAMDMTDPPVISTCSFLFRVLDEKEPEEKNVVDTAPALYLVCEKDGGVLKIRKTGKSLAEICSIPGYDLGKSPDENLSILRLCFQVEMGEKKVGYPYELIYGKGVVAAVPKRGGFGTIGHWYRIPKFEGSASHIQFCQN